MDVLQYVKPEVLVIVPVLWMLGKLIKGGSAINDKHIPLFLGCSGILLAALWYSATMPLGTVTAVLQIVFEAVVQGVLCAGLAVYGHQVLKQYTRGDGDE